MKSLDELLDLRGADLTSVAAALDVDPGQREGITGYQGLEDVDAIDAPDGTRIIARGDALVLVYVGRAALPAGLTSAALVDAVGSAGKALRSRQGKQAQLHVVAKKGIAWSESDGEVGFVEIFPPTSFDDYTRDIYVEPAKRVR
ncbi:hypothetical protein [Cellulomonas sp. URHD0024]|uniref:hypothetical protein n=1 Tax=Cellulomonas sp. URHD0024 TaxID=1302620 RepID=UPI00040951F3|nr:hypothetical protein [Cellulomonas sp. URHD0024]